MPITTINESIVINLFVAHTQMISTFKQVVDVCDINFALTDFELFDLGQIVLEILARAA